MSKLIPKGKYDFSGYATKNDIVCQDGRVIMKDAFAHHHGTKVPLVWQHDHNNPGNVLGHAYLENRDDGVYTYGVFNDTEVAQDAKELITHGDLNSLSIYANQLRQNGSNVQHGMIREVSLVLTGANPGAYIDDIVIHSGDGGMAAEIYHGIEFNTEENKMDRDFFAHEEQDERTIGDIYEGMSEEEQLAVQMMMAEAAAQAIDSYEEDEEYEDEDEEMEHSGLGGNNMRSNIFEQEGVKAQTLSHGAINEFLTLAERTGSLQAAIKHSGAEYGIENIDFLFPDARVIGDGTPDFISRDMEYVADILASTHKTPFSIVKSVHADITEDKARALGYITGKKKKEEVFKLLKRTTHPTTIYKKQKLDRDTVIDASTINVVAWMKGEMNTMLREELAGAILLGDGRAVESDDHIAHENIRPIATDDDLYAHKVEYTKGIKLDELVDLVLRNKKHYKGSGSPTLYASNEWITELLLQRDGMGRRLYNSLTELAAAMSVSKIVEVELMEEGQGRLKKGEKAILVNLKDYNIGTNRGGELTSFEDFDIDYNQHKYLLETRLSGALIKPKSALVFIEKGAEEQVEG